MNCKIFLLTALTTASLSVSAQPKAKYNKTDFELGNIAWHTKATTTIRITNAGNKPLQIISAEPGCECALVSWSKAPVAPGSSTAIEVVYDAQTLGTFRREIAVTTNAAATPTYVTLTGTVLTEVAESPAPLPYKINNVSLSTELLEFDDVALGETPSVSVSIVNGGKTDYTPEFINMPVWLTYKSYPEVIPPGSSGRVTFTLNSSDLPGMGLTKTSIYIARYHGDKKRNSSQISVCATLVPKVTKSVVDDNSSSNAIPLAVIPSTLNMGKKFGKKRAHQVTYLENQGTAPLHVTALQVYNAAISVILSDTTIEPGRKVSLRVTTKSNVLQSKDHPRILIMTDDPIHPKLSIDLTGE